MVTLVSLCRLYQKGLEGVFPYASVSIRSWTVFWFGIFFFFPNG